MNKNKKVKFSRFEVFNLVSPRKDINKKLTYTNEEFKQMKTDAFNEILKEKLQSLKFMDLIEITEKYNLQILKSQTFDKNDIIEKLFMKLKK